jgi:hypothetical protein
MANYLTERLAQEIVRFVLEFRMGEWWLSVAVARKQCSGKPGLIRTKLPITVGSVLAGGIARADVSAAESCNFSRGPRLDGISSCCREDFPSWTASILRGAYLELRTISRNKELMAAIEIVKNVII